MSAATEVLVPIPVRPDDLLRVNAFFPFEEGEKRLLFVVENAAFTELDDAGWALANMLAGHPRTSRKATLKALSELHGEEAAVATVEGFEQLEILEPADRPRLPADMSSFGVMGPMSSLVLHVAHDCNLRCGYCYADFGRYGDSFGMMDEAMAIAHIDKFFDQLGDRKTVSVTFFGGEPLMNMPVVYAGHAHAKARAEREGRKVGFSLTTNGTLLTQEAVDFFIREKFVITVSIDGPPDINDKIRPIERGSGSYEKIMERVRTTGLHPIARVTLTKKSTDVARIVRHLVDAGFKDVGVSPVASGSKKFDFEKEDLAQVMIGMRALADDFVAYAKQGKVFPFSNMRGILEQIGAGEPRPLPCGAATNLAAADNKGDVYACHRLVGNEQFKIGTVKEGIDRDRRFNLIGGMHPRTRAPCQSCWARYLCGGGCHHIAWLHSGKGEAPWTIADDFCDFLRDMYRLGLYTYARVADEAPEMLSRLKGTKDACSQPAGL